MDTQMRCPRMQGRPPQRAGSIQIWACSSSVVMAVGTLSCRGFDCKDGCVIRAGQIGLKSFPRILIVRAQPADEDFPFLGGAGVVEGDEVGEECIARQGPTSGRSGAWGENGEGLVFGRVGAVQGRFIRRTAAESGPCQVLPAIRFQHGGIEIIMDLPENGNESLVVDRLFLGGQRSAGADGFEHVRQAGEREVRVKRLLLLAVPFV